MSKIEWCNITKDAKVVDGCSPKSRGCDHCWAAYDYGVGRQQDVPAVVEQHAEDGSRCGVRPGVKRELVTVGKTRNGLMRGIYNGRVALNPERLRNALEKIPHNGGMRYPRDPETGKADRSKPKVPRGNVVFWNSSSDTFHDRLTFTEVAAQFAVMAARPDLRFLVLTKRPRRAWEFFSSLNAQDPIGHLRRELRKLMGDYWMAERYCRTVLKSPPLEWRDMPFALGVSAEDQKHWDERVPPLLKMKERGDTARAFVSAEPLLGPIRPSPTTLTRIDQVIIGAESGVGARPCRLEWIQQLAGAALEAQDICTDCAGAGGWQAATTDMFQVAWQECPKCRGEGTTGPRLFVKQADVCESCGGRGRYVRPAVYEDVEYQCQPCAGAGMASKVRKGCPPIYIPGCGTRSWAQRMEGF